MINQIGECLLFVLLLLFPIVLFKFYFRERLLKRNKPDVPDHKYNCFRDGHDFGGLRHVLKNGFKVCRRCGSDLGGI